LSKIYSLIRTLHLYFGLFISPFILIFSLSALVFNHSVFFSRIYPIKTLPEVRTILDSIPYDTTDLSTAKAIMNDLGLSGEIDFISNNSRLITFPINKPGLKLKVEVNKSTKNVVITRHLEGPLRGMSYLHIMPGQHNAKIRGNSVYIKVWRKLSDAVVYLLLFLTASGIILWYFLESERKPGLYALILGVLIFTFLLFLIF
jgi:hypothetical protein